MDQVARLDADRKAVVDHGGAKDRAGHKAFNLDDAPAATGLCAGDRLQERKTRFCPMIAANAATMAAVLGLAPSPMRVPNTGTGTADVAGPNDPLGGRSAGNSPNTTCCGIVCVRTSGVTLPP